MLTIDLSLASRISDETSLETLHVAEFYDRAICAALTGVLAGRREFVGGEAYDRALIEARALTERRFGVRLILPGDKEGQ